MNKKLWKLLLLIPLIGMTTLSSCNSDDDTGSSSTGTDSINTSTPNYKVQAVREYTAEEFANKVFADPGNNSETEEEQNQRDSLRQTFLESDSNLCKHMADSLGANSSLVTTYRQVVLNYTTKDHAGNDIVLSGLVTYQTWRKMLFWQPVNQVDNVIIENHYTITANNQCPSQNGTNLEMAAYTYPGVVISADYEGYGESSTKPHPYLDEETTARHQVEFVKVALDYINTDATAKEYIKLVDNYKTYNMGFSQGGAVTLAVQRYLEEKEPALCKKINFRGSIAGDGPYDLEATFNFYKSNNHIYMPIVLPLIIKGMMTSYPELFKGIKLSDYLNPDFANVGNGLEALIASKAVDTDGFNALIKVYGVVHHLDWMEKYTYNITEFDGTKTYTTTDAFILSKLLSKDALDENSTIYKALMTALKKNNVLTGWVPKHPVILYHSDYDLVVPVVNLNSLKTNGWPSNIYLTNIGDIFWTNHVTTGYKFYLTYILSHFADLNYDFMETYFAFYYSNN